MDTSSAKQKAKAEAEPKFESGVTRRMPWVAIGVITSIVIIIGLLISVMPKGFKSTHEQIGTGKSAVVFVYDLSLTVSNSQTEQMNEARDYLSEHLDEQVFFLIASVGTPEGKQLIAKYHAKPAEILLFDPSGRLIKRQYALKSASELIQWLR
ncbi:hypothetical protein Sps_02981 [Shewanella psychrophila]|uniref:Uncharacterized protein n=1 Tax=Shewanella psychrophila TaxID=225848 RepID=A0A1S6HRK2_9GAMM|nr:hypothetical protein [Shewanella psychrophila]AQS38128.1 hypothetical protein Sps_02981 [Shewanella psychrophila]